MQVNLLRNVVELAIGIITKLLSLIFRLILFMNKFRVGPNFKMRRWLHENWP